jgi:hypothetical protein
MIYVIFMILGIQSCPYATKCDFKTAFFLISEGGSKTKVLIFISLMILC